MDYSFGTWIKRRRKALDLTQQELAKQVGCSPSLIFKIEADNRRPSRQIANLLAEHLEIPSEQRDQFLKVARQEKAIDSIEDVTPFSPPQLVSSPKSPQPNLPIPLTSLIGREHELRAIIQQIQEPSCHLLTLTGPGGVGKTRLALEVAHRLYDFFEDGTYIVPLVGRDTSDFIVPAIAEVLGLVFSGTRDIKIQLFNYLKEKEMLLILDNLEHLLDGIEVIDDLLKGVPHIKLLTTSREHLNLRSEWVFEVQGLPVPSSEELENLETNSAITLFAQRAQQIQMDFQLAQEDTQAIIRICQLMDGLPLGLELAATWVRKLSCHEIVQEIENNMDFLTANARDLPQRHRSMRAVFDYSWKLLTEEEHMVLMRFAVFRGGFTRKAAEKVARATLPLLSSLIDKSLVRRSGDNRYNLHELVRQYARERLNNSGTLEETYERHFEFFLSLAEESVSKLRGEEQIAWLSLLEEDYDNLRTALEWSIGDDMHHVGEPIPQKSLRLTSVLYSFWAMRGYWSEGRQWLHRVLAISSKLPPSMDHVIAVSSASLLAVEQADTRSARELAEKCLVLAREIGDSYGIAQALITLGTVLWKQKDFVTARDYSEQALTRYRELGLETEIADTLRILVHITTNQNDIESAQVFAEECTSIFLGLGDQILYAAALSDLGLLKYLLRDFAVAHSYQEKSLKLLREAGSIAGIEMSLNRLGDIARCEGDYDRAEKYYSESLTVYSGSGDKDEIPSILHNLGYTAGHRCDYASAMTFFQDAMTMHVETENQIGIAECLAGVAAIFTAQGQAERGARLFGMAEVMREKNCTVIWPANQIEYDRSLTLLHESLDDSTIVNAWNEGRNMSFERAMTEAGI